MMDINELIELTHDPNCGISVSLFSVLYRSSITRSDIVNVTAKALPVKISSIGTTYRLKDLMDPVTNGGDITKSIARARAFMFSHGMLTLNRRLPGQSEYDGELIVPNAVARELYLKELETRLGLRDYDISELFHCPTSVIVNRFLQSIVDSLTTIPDDCYSEGEYQVSIESFLRALVLRNSRYKVFCDSKIAVSSDQAGEGYVDLLLIDTMDHKAILLELKRVRYGYIDVTEFPKKTNRFNYKGKRMKVQGLSDDALLSLLHQPAPTEDDQYPNKVTVKETLEAAAKQCESYLSDLKLNGFSENGICYLNAGADVAGFAVVQVDERMAISKV